MVNLGDGKTIEKVAAEVRAIVQCYQQALDRCAGLAFTALKLGVAERYADQLERSTGLFARVLAEGMRLLAVDIPPESYTQVIPLAIAAVQKEIDGQP